MRRGAPAALAAVVLATAGAGCGDDGPSAADRERARTTVCAARAAIAREVTTLRALTPDLASVPAVVRAVAAIRADLARARAARADLDDATAASVERDAAALEARALAVKRATLSGGLAGDVRGALEPAIAGLAQGARSAFSRPGC